MALFNVKSKDLGETCTPLQLAAIGNHVEVMKVFLGVPVVDATGDEETNREEALGIAATQGHLASIKVLLEAGVNPLSTVSYTEYTPIDYAALKANKDALKLLLLNGTHTTESKLASFPSNFLSPFIDREDRDIANMAALEFLVMTIKDMCKPANLNWERLGFLSEALHFAVSRNNLDALQLLLDAGVDPNALARDRVLYEKATALHLAAGHGSVEAAEALLAAGANVNAPTISENHSTPLHWAASYGNLLILEYLLFKGADKTSLTGLDRASPLTLAARYGDTELAQCLLDAGADIEGEEGSYVTPLYAAVDENEVEMVKWLVQGGANVNALSGKNEARRGSPLHLATNKNSTALVELLIQLGADPNIKELPGEEAPLHSVSSPEVASLLINAGADVQARTRIRKTPMHYICSTTSSYFTHFEACMKCLQVLTTAGASLHAVDESGDTLLHVAAKKNTPSAKLVAALLDAGCDGAVRNNQGLTPFDAFINEKKNNWDWDEEPADPVHALWRWAPTEEKQVAALLLPSNPHGWELIPPNFPSFAIKSLDLMWQRSPENLSKLCSRFDGPIEMQRLFRCLSLNLKEVVWETLRGLQRWLPAGTAPPELRRQILEMVFS